MPTLSRFIQGVFPHPDNSPTAQPRIWKRRHAGRALMVRRRTQNQKKLEISSLVIKPPQLYNIWPSYILNNTNTWTPTSSTQDFPSGSMQKVLQKIGRRPPGSAWPAGGSALIIYERRRETAWTWPIWRPSIIYKINSKESVDWNPSPTYPNLSKSIQVYPNLGAIGWPSPEGQALQVVLPSRVCKNFSAIPSVNVGECSKKHPSQHVSIYI